MSPNMVMQGSDSNTVGILKDRQGAEIFVRHIVQIGDASTVFEDKAARVQGKKIGLDIDQPTIN
jgi:hypothetical protein